MADLDYVFMLTHPDADERGELTTQLIQVHGAPICQGINCCIHHPSNHHMIAWPQVWRPRLGVITRQCAHGQQHPDPDDLSAKHLACDCHCGCCNPNTVELPSL